MQVVNDACADRGSCQREVVDIGNCAGADVDKFAAFKRTAGEGLRVKAPRACYANLERKLVDAKLVPTYNFCIFKVVKARAATSPKKSAHAALSWR